MLKNYLLTAFREIRKNKTFSIIHVFGLSMGIAAFVLIMQYALYELSYENFYRNSNQIYRVRQDRYNNGKLSTTWGAGCSAIGPALKKEFPEVLSFARLQNIGGIFNIEEKNFREDRCFAANTSFLTMFPVKLISGNDSTALDEPETAVISESIANKYFGGLNAIGKTFQLQKQVTFRITGIFKDIPDNTHLKFNMLISWPTVVKWRGPQIENAWQWDGFYTYIRLPEGTDIQAFEKKMNKFTDEQTGVDQAPQRLAFSVYSLQPLKSIHLNSHLMWEAEVNGNAKTVYFLMVIAIIILVIAWVNYVNLSTVKAISRAREVAVRKISGASRFHLIRQFLIESFLINLIASLIALIIVLVSIPYLRMLTGREMTMGTEAWLAFVLMIIAGPVIAGFYPAMVISSFKPISIFRGKLNGAASGTGLRKILVIFQFAASVALIAGTFTVYHQLIYMRNQDLGVNIDQTLVIKGPGVADSTYDAKLTRFKEELLKYPVIKSIAASTSVPGSKVYWNAGGIRLIGDDNTKSNQYRIVGIDYDFADAYKLSFVTGRNFSKEYSTDDSTVIFNEQAIKLMGFDKPESAIGKVIFFWGNNYKIIGVLKNFHQASLKENFDALIFRCIPGARDYFSIKLNFSGQSGSDSFKTTQNTIKTIKSNWEQFFPGNPFDYFFLSDRYDDQYRAEKQFRSIFGLFAILAIVIACLGLFGLSWFIIIQRTKEIGLRKVNGASAGNILLLIAGEFFKLVLAGIIIAAPVAYFFSVKWLEKFPFRIGFSWWLFILSGLIIALISALTISYNTIVISRTNPAKSLKYE